MSPGVVASATMFPRTGYHPTMKFGIALPIDHAYLAQSAGFDYLEEDLTGLLSPHLPDDQWHAPPKCTPPVLVVHGLIPESMPITGPTVNLTGLRLHVQRACERAGQLGIRVISLSSPGALRIPEGFDPKQAKSQILEFLRTAVPFFARYELMLVAGVNSTADCNVMTTLPEVMQYVWAVDHPWFQCSLNLGKQDGDSSTEQIHDAAPWIRHVQFSDELTENFQSALSELKQSKYDDIISLNAPLKSSPNEIYSTLNDLRVAWNTATTSLSKA
jgi:xylose isomerase-like TIM barrel protein